MTRSENMARIKSRDTTPEKTLREALLKRGLQYVAHATTPIGRPDVVFPMQKVAVFIDGCFWHGCPDHYVRPRSRIEFWSGRLLQNVERDQKQTTELERQGWRVLRFWEHEIFTTLESSAELVEQAVKKADYKPLPSWRVFRVDPLNEDGSLERRFLVELRDKSLVREVEQARHTRKWAKPKTGEPAQPKTTRPRKKTT